MGFIIGTIFGSLIILFFTGIGIYFLLQKKSKNKLIKKLGSSAEEKINNDLKIWAKHTKNKFINAGVFKYKENKVFEVDSILVTSRAVIVIEIKSINGGVKGSATDEYWTKILGDQYFKIVNPISQNEKHIKHIINMLNVKVPIISLIIFSNKTKFLDIKNTPSHVLVIRHADVFETLDKITIKLPKKFSEEEVKTITNNIKKFKSDRKGISLHKKIVRNKGGK